MNHYKLYIRHRGQIIPKYESAINEFEATCHALSLYRGGAIIKLVYLGVRHVEGKSGRGATAPYCGISNYLSVEV